jgi:hypothetical protein
MKPQLLMLTAASLLAAASVAQAETPSNDQLYLSVVGLQANARLASMGVVPHAEPIQVRATLSGNRLGLIRVTPTGDEKTDKAIRRSLGRMAIALPPEVMDNQEITVTLSHHASEQAELESSQPQ